MKFYSFIYSNKKFDIRYKHDSYSFKKEKRLSIHIINYEINF